MPRRKGDRMRGLSRGDIAFLAFHVALLAFAIGVGLVRG